VVCDGSTVAGYYSLTMGSVLREQAPKPLTRNMPPQIPVVILGRLAVDQRYHGRKIGPALLRNALQRSLAASTEVAARAILVHAIDLEVVSFYTQYGFKPFPEGSLTLFLSVTDIADALT
jgi:predicted N-acetyltransferase YhbS